MFVCVCVLTMAAVAAATAAVAPKHSNFIDSINTYFFRDGF